MWFLLVYGCGPTTLTSPGNVTAFVAYLLCGAGAGLAVSYVFQGAFRRARLPWALLLPLATVPLGVSVFAGLVWAATLGLRYRPAPRYLEVLNDLSLGLLFFYPLVYLLSFINQWVLHLILVEHGAYRSGSKIVRLVAVGGLLFWIALLIWFFASQRRS
jgi:ABC-type polysaccharide/polyol phosphate export permease